MTSIQKIIKYCALAFAVFLIVSIIGGIFSALGMVFVFFNGDEAGERKTYTVSGQIERLDVDISAAAFQVITGDSFSVESNHNNLSVREKDGTLKISEDKVLFSLSSQKVSVVLTIPEGYYFEDAIISTGAGSVDIDTLSANTLDMDFGAGSVDVDMLSANTLDMDFGAGAADIDCLNVYSQAKVDGGTGKLVIRDGELHDLSMDMGVGKLKMMGKITGNSEVEYGIGSTELTLVGNREDYQIELDKGIGSATLEGEKMSDDSVYGSGQNHLQIEGGIGKIQIEFK